MDSGKAETSNEGEVIDEEAELRLIVAPPRWPVEAIGPRGVATLVRGVPVHPLQAFARATRLNPQFVVCGFLPSVNFASKAGND